MSKILVLKTNSEIEVRDYPEQDVKDTLKYLQVTVGGYIDFVKFGRIRLTMVINEEGKIRQMPINPVASYFYWREFGSFDQIAGNVAFLSSEINEVGDPVGLTDQQVLDLKTDIGWRLEEIEEAQFNDRLDRDEYIRESEGE